MKNTSHSDNMDIAKIEEQLNDLLNMVSLTINEAFGLLPTLLTSSYHASM